MINHLVLLYVDPGSGSYLIQVIIAAIFGAWFWLKGYFWKVKNFFSKKSVADQPDEKEPDINND